MRYLRCVIMSNTAFRVNFEVRCNATLPPSTLRRPMFATRTVFSTPPTLLTIFFRLIAESVPPRKESRCQRCLTTSAGWKRYSTSPEGLTNRSDIGKPTRGCTSYRSLQESTIDRKNRSRKAEMAEIYDPNRKCPKCGGPATTHFDPIYNMMVRHCGRCGYTWRERPKDHQKG